MVHKRQTAKDFELDGSDRLINYEDVFVCTAKGTVRLSDPDDSAESGGTDASTLVRVKDYIVEGTSHRPDVIIKVLQVARIVRGGFGVVAKCELAYAQAYVFNSQIGEYDEKPWKPLLKNGTPLSKQLDSYSQVLLWRLRPRRVVR